MTESLQAILATTGSVAAIRGLGLSNGDLVATAGEIASLLGYHGQLVRTGTHSLTIDYTHERVTKMKALASAVILAQS